MANTFNLGNGNWAQKTEKLLAYNAENDNYKPLPFDFDRGSIATRVNRDGLIETVGVDEPRIDFLNNPKGHLLLEPSRQNKVPYSEDFTSSLWSAQSGATKQHNVAISPDGNQNASKFNFDGTSNGRVEYNNISGLTVGISYTISVYLKSESGNIENVQIGDAGWGLKTVTVTNEWQRYTQTITSNGSTAYPRVRLDAVGSVLVWGYQLEAGSYATSYIPTSGSAVTRSAETTNNAGNSNVFNDSEGVLFVESSAFESTVNSNAHISISNGTTSNVLYIYYATDGNISFAVFVGGSLVCNIGAAKTQNEFHKIAVKYKENDFALWIDGVEVATDTSGSTFTEGTLDRLSFTSAYNNPFFAKTKQVMYFDEALSDTELQALTTI